MSDILVLEDHPLVAEAAGSLFAKLSGGNVVLCSNVECAAAELERASSWYRIFLDVTVPGAQGLSFIRHVHAKGLAGRSVIITGTDDDQWRTEVESMGFLGYVLKTASVTDFNSALSEIFSGRRHFSTARQDQPTFSLTRKQIAVLTHLRDGLSVERIAETMELPVGSVRGYVAAAISALRATDLNHAIETATILGYTEAARS